VVHLDDNDAINITGYRDFPIYTEQVRRNIKIGSYYNLDKIMIGNPMVILSRRQQIAAFSVLLLLQLTFFLLSPA
jgi:hypothetical protein